MTKRRFAIVPVVVLLLSAACQRAPQDYSQVAQDSEILHATVWKLTEVMMESVTSPVVASRNFAYASVAAYEAARPGAEGYASLAGQLNELTPVPEPEPGVELLPVLAGTSAFLTVAEALVFAPEKIAAYRDSVERSFRERGVPKAVVRRSMEHGAAVGRHVLAWAETDGIKAARSAERLVIQREPGRWLPTPPAYMDAVEPSWGTLRPFVLASATEVPIAPPAEYDLSPDSEFQKQLREVTQVGQGLSREQREIAAFWDCNPFAVEAQGHIMAAVKKISPGGHWMSITGNALRREQADPVRTADAYARVAVALADGFITAWEGKYRTVRVRPVTVAQEQVDPMWQPLLQTPPFPEYPSGHSVISGAASEVLTDLFGDQFAYTDSTNVYFGLPARRFASFRQAAEEAALSRLYGGIHFRDANDNGLAQGRGVGQVVVQRLGGKGTRLAARDADS